MFDPVLKRVAACTVVLLITWMFGCQPVSRDEVARQSSPDGTLEAVLYETNGGATTSFGYQAEIREKNSSRGIIVANLYGAKRNAGAYGLNLKWINDHELELEYLTAISVTVTEPQAKVAGRRVSVSLQNGMEDATAPDGGMLYNLRKGAPR